MSIQNIIAGLRFPPRPKALRGGVAHLARFGGKVVSLWTRYWAVLSRLGRSLLVLEIILLVAFGLFLAFGQWPAEEIRSLKVPLPAWRGMHNLPLGLPRPLIELLTLALSGIFWCSWCEGTYCLNSHYRPGMQARRAYPRLVLYMYSGLFTYLLLSMLASINILLSGAVVFFLFCGFESTVAQSNRGIWVQIVKGITESYQNVGIGPWRILRTLALTGISIYVFQLLISSLGDWIVGTGELEYFVVGLLIMMTTTLMMVAYFFVGRINLQYIYILNSISRDINKDNRQVKEIIDRIRGNSNTFPARLSIPTQRFLLALNVFRRTTSIVVGLLLASAVLYVMFFLITDKLLTFDNFYLGLQGLVDYFSSVVQGTIGLISKVGFIIIITGFLLVAIWMIIRISEGQEFIKSLTDSFNDLSVRFAKAFKRFSEGNTSFQLTSLISAFGVIVLNTYSRVQKDQQVYQQQRQSQNTIMQRQSEKEKQFSQEMSKREKEYRDRIFDYSKSLNDPDKKERLDAEHDITISYIRDLLPRLTIFSGQPDPIQKGKLLKFIYEAGLLSSSNKFSERSQEGLSEDRFNKMMEDKEKENNASSSAITYSNLPTLPQALINKILEGGNYGAYTYLDVRPRLFFYSMDFSNSDLESAFLEGAFIPFIDLSKSDLSGANLKGADLRYANLESANLSGADLRGTHLDHANLTGAVMDQVILDEDTTYTDAITFYARTKSVGTLRKKINKSTISWAQVNNPYTIPDWCPFWEDDESTVSVKSAKDFIIQSGAKCRNRSFQGAEKSFRRRIWAGSDFRDTDFKDLTLEEIDLSGSDFQNARFENVNFKNVKLLGANLDGTQYINCDLDGVDFSGAQLKNATFNSVKFRHITLNGTLYQMPLSMGSYGTRLMGQTGFDTATFNSRIEFSLEPVKRTLLAPLIGLPVPLRPVRLLFWIVPYFPDMVIVEDVSLGSTSYRSTGGLAQ